MMTDTIGIGPPQTMVNARKQTKGVTMSTRWFRYDYSAKFKKPWLMW